MIVQYQKTADSQQKLALDTQVELMAMKKRSEVYEKELSNLNKKLNQQMEKSDDLIDKKSMEINRLQRRLEQVTLEREAFKRAIADYQRFMGDIFEKTQDSM